MIKIWHYQKGEEWVCQTIDLKPDVELSEILKSMDIPEEPSFVLGTSNNFLAVFKNSEDKYLCSMEMQDIKQLVVIHDFPSFLSFLEKINTILFSVMDMEAAFGNED